MSHNLIPLFWREADDGVRKVLDAATGSIDDLFLDIDTRYKALKIEDCPDYKPELFRPMYVYMLVNEDGVFDIDLWGKLTNYQKRYFQNAYFIWPDKELDPEAEVDDRKWVCLQEMSWCRTIYCGSYIENGVDFDTSVEEVSTEKNQITFYRNPFITFDAKWQNTEITTPWRKTYPCRMLTLWVSDLTMSESVLDTHYADLVMDKDSQKIFRSTGAYSAFVYNFYKVLYQGATVLGLCGFVNSISNYDCIKSDWETIEAVYFESVPDGEPGEMRRVIATDKNKYYLPMDIQPGSWLEMGKSYPKFTPIAEVIQVLTYLENPDWPFGEDGGYLEDIIVTTDGVHEPERAFDFSYNSRPPRFDLCRLYERHPESHPESSDPGSTVFQYGMQSLEEGLWHNVVGPNLVVLNFTDENTYNAYHVQFEKILKEIVPIHVHCTITTDFSGWFFYDEEEEAWFTDEYGSLIEDPEGRVSLVLTQPVAGTVYSPGDTIQVAGSSYPEDQPVVIYVNNVRKASLSGGVFSYEFTANAPGEYVVRAETEFVADTSAVECRPYTLSLSAPDNAFTGVPVELSGETDARDGYTVALSIGSEQHSLTVTGGQFTYTWTPEQAGMVSVSVSGEYMEPVSKNITVMASMRVVAPVNGQQVQCNIGFSTVIELATDGTVGITADGANIAELQIIDGVASGSLVIPDYMVGAGSTFIVNGGTETPVGNIAQVTLMFTHDVLSEEVTVNVVGSPYTNMGTTSASVGRTPVSLGAADLGETVVSVTRTPATEGEFSMGTTEVSVVRV